MPCNESSASSSPSTVDRGRWRLGAAGWIALLLLLPPPLFWAGNFIVGRAVRDEVPPFTLMFGRWAIALLLLLPFAWRALRRDLPRYWQYRWRLLAVSLAGIVGFNGFVYFGLQSTTAANGLLLNSFIPMQIVLLGALFYRQPLQANQVLGLLLSFGGVLAIVVQGEWARLMSLAFTRGDLIIVCATLCWAFYTLWLRGIPADIERIGLMAAQIMIGLLVLLPLFLWEHATAAPAIWNSHSISALAYLGVFPSVLAYLLYNVAVMRVGAARASLSIHLIPVFGIGLAVLFLHESVHLYHALGVAAIGGGILMCTLGWPRRSH